MKYEIFQINLKSTQVQHIIMFYKQFNSEIGRRDELLKSGVFEEGLLPVSTWVFSKNGSRLVCK